MKLIHYGTVNDGRVKFSHRKQFDHDVKALEGMRVQITIQKAKKGRSNEQNAYLWGVVYPCALQGFIDAGNDGLTVDDVHDFFKGRFLFEGKEILIPRTGEVVVISKTTTTLSTTEMMDYIERIAQFCAEFLSVVIPEPMPLMPV